MAIYGSFLTAHYSKQEFESLLLTAKDSASTTARVLFTIMKLIINHSVETKRLATWVMKKWRLFTVNDDLLLTAWHFMESRDPDGNCNYDQFRGHLANFKRIPSKAETKEQIGKFNYAQIHII